MRTSILSSILTVAVVSLITSPTVAHADSATSQIANASAANKFAFVLFWKQNDPATDAMQRALAVHLADKSARATAVSVQITDPEQRSIVEEYGVSRFPMPLVLAVAPNGAVTAAVQGEITAEQVRDAIVSPATADCFKSLQEGKTVVMVVHPRADAQPMTGTQQFLSSPHFSKRTTFVRLVSANPEEGQFMQKLGVSPQEANGCVVLMAPPGVVVGKFPMQVSGQELANKLHAAGKCCNDPNCKHNHQ